MMVQHTIFLINHRAHREPYIAPTGTPFLAPENKLVATYSCIRNIPYPSKCIVPAPNPRRVPPRTPDGPQTSH